ncbi:uncharacterized protein LOC108925492 isoform X1 [Scleropages formosus]|uniref:Si:ch211-168f7.5 n=2 Tax=Scleropages formosus TaxID=113540 RepID=A0A8C9WNY0_SCLFO|nr:uncharacterized protein LOC108925492 isoform X1 [Scleropages formosus]
MAGRRGCVTSLWSGSERVRIGERLKASLAGIVELDLLRCRHWEMVEAVLGRRGTADTAGSQQRETGEEDVAVDGASRSRRQQVSSPSKCVLPCFDSIGTSMDPRWSTLSWDIPSDPLSPPTPDSCAAQLDCDSRPSSGFYSVSGSSLSDSCCSVCSEGGQGTAGVCIATRGSCGPWDCQPHSRDHSATQWQEARKMCHNTHGLMQKGERRPFSTGDLEISGLLFLSNFCSGQGEEPSDSPPNGSFQHWLQLDPKFCSDLVSRKTKEVYPYPSPLHAVALQSPLFTSCQNSSPPLPNPAPSPETLQTESPKPEAPPRRWIPTSPSLSQLDQYISKLVLRYHARTTAEIGSRPGSRKWHSGPGHGSSQSLASFDGHGGVSQRRSLFGNSGSVSLSSTGKGGGSCRNSINLGNLPSLNGDNLNLSFHLNLNLNLNPNLNVNTSISMDPTNAKGPMGSCDYLDNETPTPTPSPSSSSSVSTSSAWRGRKRISTCPQTINHRGSLEIKGSGFGPQGFSRSLDWSGLSQEEAEKSPCAFYQSSPKISEDSEKVCEIARVSGLPRSVVAGLLEEGVELDIDCFRNDENQDEGAGVFSARPHSPVSNLESLPQSNQPSEIQFQSDQSDSRWSDQIQYQAPPVPETQSLPSQSSTCPSDGESPLDGQLHGFGPPAQSPSHFDCHPSALAHPAGLPTVCQRTPSPCGSPSGVQPAATRSTHPGHSPPLLQPNSLYTPPPLSVFRRSSPSQSSLPRLRVAGSPMETDVRPRGGSLRHEAGTGWGSGGRAWRRMEGERLYQGKHVSRELVRASTVTSFAGRERSTEWGEGIEESVGDVPKRGASFRKRLEGLFGGKEKERGGGGSEKEGGKWKVQTERPSGKNKDGGAARDGEKENHYKHKYSSASRRPPGGLFRSESQGFLEPRSQKREPRDRRQQWVSSLEIARAGLGRSSVGLSLERGKAFGVGADDECLSSTASLFHLSRSQSPEGSCVSLSPLSSPSLSPPPPPPARLTRSRSFRDLGRRVFGSVKPFSFKTQSLRK